MRYILLLEQKVRSESSRRAFQLNQRSDRVSALMNFFASLITHSTIAFHSHYSRRGEIWRRDSRERCRIRQKAARKFGSLPPESEEDQVRGEFPGGGEGDHDSRHDEERREAVMPRQASPFGIRDASFAGEAGVVIESTARRWRTTVQGNTPGHLYPAGFDPAAPAAASA